MPTLHIINKASALSACLSIAAVEDALLLIEDGVYAATKSGASQRPLYALEADVNARGIAALLGPSVRVVNDTDFVRLAVNHQPIVSWR
jgi:tRNA 2-thiouridine synthesizing protein B